MQQAIINRTRAVAPHQPQGQGLRIVPVLGPSHDEPSYRLLDSQTMGSVKVTEISQSGSVPELRVENRLDTHVFLMDGQELVGAKQNRILNTDVLVPPAATLSIPVSCVEQGRWRHISPHFTAGKTANYRTRAGKSRRVYESLKEEGRHDADQSAVWHEVAETISASHAPSETMALHDAYAYWEAEFQAFRRSVQLPGDTVGLAVFHSGRFQGIDLFDRHSTLMYFWESLIDSYAIDWLGATIQPVQAGGTPESQTLTEVLDRAVAGKWERFESPGEGADWRLDEPALSGSALIWNDTVVVHLQIFPRQLDHRSERPSRPRIHRRYGPDEGTAH
jgi:hypothetical protein